MLASVQFGKDVSYTSVKIWYLDQVRPFLEDADSRGPQVLARTYSQVVREGDKRLVEESCLDYSIIELVPGLLGREWTSLPGYMRWGPGRVPYPAMMEVIHGRGWLILQKMGVFDRLLEVYRVQVQEHDRLMVPPGYGEVLLNAGQDVLVTAWLQSRHAVSSYDRMARYRGAAYYIGPEAITFNRHYSREIPLQELEVSMLAPTPLEAPDLYGAAIKNPRQFLFLDPP